MITIPMQSPHQFSPEPAAAGRRATRGGALAALVIAALAASAPSSAQASQGYSKIDITCFQAVARNQYDRALKACATAARKGNVEAEYKYGQVLSASGNERDRTIAIKWWTKAAARHHARANWQLGQAYEHGFGVKPNRQRAIRHIEAAAHSGLPIAEFRYATLLEHSKQPADSIAWYRRAAQAGWPNAQERLAMLFLHGKLVPANPKVGLFWLRKAAQEGGNLAAKMELAVRVGNARPKEGLVLLQEVVAQVPDGRAYFLMAELMAKNAQTTDDLHSALGWVDLAVRNGDPQAVALHGQIVNRLAVAGATRSRSQNKAKTVKAKKPASANGTVPAKEK